MKFKQVFKDIAGLVIDPLYRNSFFAASAYICNAGFGFVFWIIVARMYTIEQVGLATALISSLGLTLLFSRLGFDFSVIRFISLENKGKVISTSLIITTAASILAGVIFILLADIVSPSMIFLKEPGYALAFLMIVAMNSVANVTGNAFIAERKADHYFLQNLLVALRIPALVPLAFLGVFGIFWSVGLGLLVASIFGLAALQRRIAAIQPEVDWDFIRRSFRFSSLNYVSGILSVAPILIIPIMVLNMLGEAEAAKYYIAFAIGDLPMSIPCSLGTSLFVEGSHGEGLRKSAIRAGAASMILLVPAVLVLVLFGDMLLGMLKGEYVEAFDLLRIIAISCYPVAVYSLFIPIQNVRMKVDGVVKLNALRCLLLLGLNYVLIPRYGILGTGYAWMTTYGVIALGIGWIAWRERWI